MTEGKVFNILSIDGGGIKGLYAARVIEQIEQRYGKKIHEHFDLICGTSTGGLIALALSLGYSAGEVAEFYSKKGKLIFPHTSWYSRLFYLLKQGLVSNKYKSDTLRNQMVDFFGEDKKLKHCKTLLCIPAFNISKGIPIVFKYAHEEGNFYRDAEIDVIDVALATSAAPTYFPNHTINASTLPNTICTDGGVWCNNPALSGLLEAWDYFVGDGKMYDSVNLLSVSTIPEPTGSDFHGGGFVRWGKRMMTTALEGQSYFTNHFLTKISKSRSFNLNYYRVVPENISKEQYKLIKMDLASKKAITLLNRLGTESGVDLVSKKHNWLSEIFNKQKSFLTNKL